PSALKRPKQLGIGAWVGYPNLAVGRDAFGFEQAPRRGAVVLRKTSEPAALNETSQAHSQASATLNVFSALGGNGVVRLNSDRPRAHRNRRLRLQGALASLGAECGIHLDVVHFPPPNQQPPMRLGCSLL